jgi:hypothetical protein
MADVGEEHVPETPYGTKHADDGAETAPKIEQPPSPRARTVWGVSYIKRKLEERKAKREKEPAADKAARLTAVATFWIAMFTLVLAILSGLTWWEIHTGGADTHNLAGVAVAQTRAWIMGYPCQPLEKITSCFQNVGRLPALEVVNIQRQFYVPEGDASPDFHCPKRTDEDVISNMRIQEPDYLGPTGTPGDKSPGIEPRPSFASDMDNIRNDKGTIIIHGCVTYITAGTEQQGGYEYCFQWWVRNRKWGAIGCRNAKIY